ncbi:hypothetical protein ACLI1A_10135 [Flavobacterium sp. RHBU_3]|uniref:hypothetical protein n=1 Tax=Flavobacterium sp. RHBU_3 TaxID=3391184 RepID=UPI003984B1FD
MVIQTITPLAAIEAMRELTDKGIPFSFEYWSYNSTKHTSAGHKIVHKAQLRQGLRNDQSDKASTLIAYTDHGLEVKPRFFHLGLLLKFNGLNVQP